VTTPASIEETFETLIPARLDRLPWSEFHWLLVAGLGITWVLDGLEVTLMGAIGAVLQRPDVLHLSAAQIGAISSAYLVGAVLGSLVFGHLTDRHGRRKFFFISLSIYLLGVGLTAFSWNLGSFALFRAITGAGIGGEYSAVNSAIDELIPARCRGRVDLMINGSFWLGAAAGAASTVVLLNPRILPVNIGWRLGFGAGAVIGLIILYMRRFIPESPRWLVTHGQRAAAEETVAAVERTVERETGVRLEDPPPDEALRLHARHRFGLVAVLKPMLTRYRSRSMLGLSLMVAQAFVYNAIFFTYALVLNRYYAVPVHSTGLYLLPFALGNFLGPVALGHFFDTLGRRQMITATFAIAALLLIATGWLFARDALTATTQTILWSARDAGAGDRGLLLGRHRRRRRGRTMVFRPTDRFAVARRPVLGLYGRRRPYAGGSDGRGHARSRRGADQSGKDRRAALFGALGACFPGPARAAATWSPKSPARREALPATRLS
jgi:MFS family permease